MTGRSDAVGSLDQRKSAETAALAGYGDLTGRTGQPSLTE